MTVLMAMMVRVIVGHSVSMSTRCKLDRLDATSGQHDDSRSIASRSKCLPRCVVHLTDLAGFAVAGRSQVLALADTCRGVILRV